MNTAVILLGSNTGNLSLNLEIARSFIINEIGNISMTSHIYETEPWGRTDQPVFYNQVIVVTTSADARLLMKKLLEIENEMGRKRTEKWAPRLIDLDILYFNDEVIDEPGLHIPHPHLHERRFTIEPLCEILPDMMHPVLRKTNRDLLRILTDNLQVRALNHEIPFKS